MAFVDQLEKLRDISLENPVALAAAGIGAVVLLAWARKGSQGPFPPGPKGHPLVGSLFSWPSHQEWLTFTKWREEYGDIVYANVAGTKIMVLNSPEAAKALLDDRGAIFSDRPHLHFANDIIGWKDSPIMCLASHPYFKPSRRMMLSAVGSRTALEGYVHMEEHEVHRFLNRVIDDPDKVEYYLRKLAGTIILRVVYGYDVVPGDDEYVDLIERVNNDLNKAATPGNFMVDFIPALAYVPRWFPGTGWMRATDRMRKNLDDVLTKPINFVKNQLAAGTARPSFVGSEITRPDWDEKKEQHLLAWTAEALYTGGADTSVSATYTFFLLMTLYPEIQARAQAEIDAVIGPDALPTWADRERLPYVDALIKEMMRWAPVAPQALPHAAAEDSTYNGYFIPKNTIVIANVYGYTRDPKVYPDPDRFDPERFLGPNPQADPRDFVFGFGRRVCPGRQLGEASLYLVTSNSLATLHVSKKIGKDGVPITPKVEYTGGAVVYPTAFECAIKPRNAKAEALIRSVHDAPFP
ncbi:cytochrome P450 [Exidia glandulosa HHB12029]|uniref:Cytochrome P450 n=1 Tax=Exidia glandulosa HHB12029 TaxID=1314781 RepID=A0A166A8I8_EXIGL|nr:cytochrome P450 [Exidia glandulosa HHB12029]